MKTLVLGLALTGALMASTSAVKANAFLEVISGNAYTTVSVPASDSASSTASIGGWSLRYSINGQASGGGGELDVDLTAITGGSSPSHGLTVIYSSGDPYTQQGTWTYGLSLSGVNTVSASADVYHSSSLYTPPSPAYNLGSFGTLLGALAPLGPTGAGGASEGEGPLPDSLSNYYITEVLYIAGGATHGAVTGSGGHPSFNGGVSFTAQGVPDGGMTMSFLGATFLGVAGIRSKFARKALRK